MSADDHLSPVQWPTYGVRHTWSANGRGVVRAIAADQTTGEETEVGRLTYRTRTRGRRVALVKVTGQMEVAPEHRRRGLASRMMDRLQAEYPETPFDHGWRTPDGEAWWQTYNRNGDKR